MVARDRYMPRQFTYRGDRLAFTTGILSLGILAGLVLARYKGEVEHLIPLYALWAKDYATARSVSELAPALLTNGLTAVVLCFVVALGLHLAVEKPFVNLR